MNDGLLSRREPGGKSLSWRIPRGVPPDGGNMQYVPDDVLQELQHQREAQEEDGAARARAHRQGERKGGTSSTAREISFPFPSSDSSHSPHSSTTKFEHSPARPSQVSGWRIEEHVGARGHVPPLSLPIRPATRSRTPTPPPRSRTSGTLPPQLVGGRAETDADLLDQSPSAPAESPHSPTPPPETPDSRRSLPTPSSTRPSELSEQSRTSSFAYFLRRHRADRRLLKKRSQPIQHRQKSQPPTPRPEATRSKAYLRPRIVEDSADHTLTTISGSSVNARNQGRSGSASRHSTNRPEIISQSVSPMSGSTSAYVQGRAHNPPNDLLPDASGSTRIDGRGAPGNNSQTSTILRSERRKEGKSTANRLRPQKSSPLLDRCYCITPPESEPSTPMDYPSRPLGLFSWPETLYENSVSDCGSSLFTLKSRLREKDRVVVSHAPAVSTPTSTREHGRRSIYGLFRRGKRPVDQQVSMNDLAVRSPASASPTPFSSIAPKGNRGDDQPSSYFVMPPRDTDAAGLASASPLATKWDDLVADSQPRGHVREVSTPMSPLSTRSKRKVPHTDSRMFEDRERQHRATEVLQKISTTGKGQRSWLPTEMTRVNTPPLPEEDNKKQRGVRGFFSNVRIIPCNADSPTATTLRHPQPDHCQPTLQARSIQTLLPKFSLPNFKHGSSHRAVQTPPVEAQDPLKVTHFEQTPFAQRYGDTRREEMTRFRTYLDETLHDSDDDESNSVPFEFDIPEHLPNSPLCPLSPKHKSGGKGICPLHGRKKSSLAGMGRHSSGTTQAPKRQRTGPTIVYDSGEQDRSSYHANHGTWKIDLDEEMSRATRL